MLEWGKQLRRFERSASELGLALGVVLLAGSPSISFADPVDRGCDPNNIRDDVRRLNPADLFELERVTRELDALDHWNRVDEETGDLRREDGEVVEDSTFTRGARIALAETLARAASQPEGLAELRDALKVGDLWAFIPTDSRAAANPGRTRLALPRVEAQTLVLLHAIAPLLRERLEREWGPTDARRLVDELILEHQSHVRAFAQVRRMLRAPDWILALVPHFPAEGWRATLSRVAPELGELSGPRGTEIPQAARVRLEESVERARRAWVTGELLGAQRRAKHWMAKFSAQLEELHQRADCVRRMLEDVRHLRELELGPAGNEPTRSAIRLSLRLSDSVSLDQLSMDASYQAELVLGVPGVAANGVTIEASTSVSDVAVARGRWATGISVRGLKLDIEHDASGAVTGIRPRLPARGIATALSVDPEALERALLDCDGAREPSSSGGCLFQLPEAFDLDVVDASVNVESGWLRVDVAREPWIPRSHPVSLWITSGQTKTSDIRRQLEGALVQAITGAAQGELAEMLDVDELLSIEVDAAPGRGPRFPDGQVRGHATIRLRGAAPLDEVHVRWQLDASGSLRIYDARIPEAARRAALEAARDWLTEWMTRANADVPVDQIRSVASYVSVDDIEVVLASSGRPTGVRGRLSMGPSVPLPEDLREALSGLELEYANGSLDVRFDPGRLLTLLEGRLRDVAERLIRSAGVRLGQLTVGRTVELFGARFTIERIEDSSVDIRGRIGTAEVLLQGVRWESGRLDLSGVRVSGPLVEQLLDGARQMLPTNLGGDVLGFSNPRFGTGHLVVDVTLKPTVLGSEIPLGSVEIGARGGVVVSASALRTINGALERRFNRWLGELPDDVLSLEGVAEVRELRLKPGFRLFGGVAVGIQGSVLLADTIPVNVTVSLLPRFSIQAEGDPVQLLLGALAELGSTFLADALGDFRPDVHVRSRPFGLEVAKFQIPIWTDAFNLSIGGLSITTQGVDLPTRFGATLPFDITLGPFSLVRPGFEIDTRDTAVHATGDLTIGGRGAERVIKIACHLKAGFRDVRFETDGTVVFLSLLPIARVDGVVDLPSLRATLHQRVVGPLSRVLQVEGTSRLDGQAKLYSSTAHIGVLGLQLADAAFDAGLEPPHLDARAMMDLPIVRAEGTLTSALDLSKVSIGASASFRVGGWDIAGADILLRLSRCRIGFSMMGVDLVGIVPGPADLTPGLIWDLLAGLFSFDPVAFFRNLAKGDITIDLTGGGGGGGADLGDGDPVARGSDGNGDGGEGGEGGGGGGGASQMSSSGMGAAQRDGSSAKAESDGGVGQGRTSEPRPDPQWVEKEDPVRGARMIGPGPGPACRLTTEALPDGPLKGLEMLRVRCGGMSGFPMGAVGSELAEWIREQGDGLLVWTSVQEWTKPARLRRNRLEFRAPGTPNEGSQRRFASLGAHCEEGTPQFHAHQVRLTILVLVTRDNRVHAVQAFDPFQFDPFGYRAFGGAPRSGRRRCRGWRGFFHGGAPPWGSRRPGAVLGSYCLGSSKPFTPAPGGVACGGPDASESGLLFCGDEHVGHAAGLSGDRCAWEQCVDPDPGCRTFDFRARSQVEFECHGGEGAECLAPLLMSNALELDHSTLPSFLVGEMDVTRLHGALSEGRAPALDFVQTRLWGEYVRAFLDGAEAPTAFSVNGASTRLHGLTREPLVVRPAGPGVDAMRLSTLAGSVITVERDARAYRRLGLDRLTADSPRFSGTGDLLMRALLSPWRPLLVDGGSNATLLHDARRGEDGKPLERGRIWLVRDGRLAAGAVLVTPWAADQADPITLDRPLELARVSHAAFLARVLRRIGRDELRYDRPPGPPRTSEARDDRLTETMRSGTIVTESPQPTSTPERPPERPLPELYFSRPGAGSGQAVVIGARTDLMLESEGGGLQVFSARTRDLTRRLIELHCDGALEQGLEHELGLAGRTCGADRPTRAGLTLTPARRRVLAQLLLSREQEWRSAMKVHPVVLFEDGPDREEPESR